MTVGVYRKKPVEIEAVQWTGRPGEIKALLDLGLKGAFLHGDTLRIPTLEGEMIASLGDYVIKGVAGEFYPCKSEIFLATYEVLV